MHEDRKLKTFLVLQSFCPLFLLLFIKYAIPINQIGNCFLKLLQGDISVIGKAINNSSFGEIIIIIVCIVWFLITIAVAVGFRDLQIGAFDSHGEKIIIKEEKRDSGATFFVTFLLPLLIEDVSTIRGVVFFFVLISLVIYLLLKTDLFYQNPVLIALNYKVFEFQFIYPNEDVVEGKTYLGMTKGELPSKDEKIKRRYIADNVFLIYKD